MSEIITKKEGIKLIKALYRPGAGSHKGQNGKVMVIGGSHLFHAASLWALEVASRIVDMVFYSSVPENNELVKAEFKNGIVVPREKIDDYINEADSVLIGPGLERTEETKELTEILFKKYPDKKWVVDAGSLQMADVELIPKNAILTPHHQEFDILKVKSHPSISLRASKSKVKTTSQNSKVEDQVKMFAEQYNVVVLLKGPEDVVCNAEKCVVVKGGNAGMTKGGTGDVLAGLAAAFYAKNPGFESAVGASFLNKLAGDSLFEKQNFMYNASDLAKEIPGVYKECLTS